MPTPSSSSDCSTRWISPAVMLAPLSSSITTGSVCFTRSMSSFTSWRPSSRPALRRTTSARCVVITDARSTTVAPVTSAWCRNSSGTQRAGSPNTGSRVGVPGKPGLIVAEHEHVVLRRFAAPDLHAVHADRVRARGQLHVVARAHERDHDAELERELAPERAHAVEQVAALARVDEVDEVERDLELERLDAHVGRDALGRVGRQRRRFGSIAASACAPRRGSAPPTAAGPRGRGAARRRGGTATFGRPGTMRDEADRAARELQRALVARELLQQVGTEVALGRGAGHDQTRRQRDEQRRDLRDETVADGQQAVLRDRVAERHVLLQDPDREAADQVDEHDHDGGDRVALHELRRTVHRAVEVGLVGDLLAAALGLGLVDQAGVEVGVDRHLLAGHRVEGEAGRDLGDAAGTVRDHDELDHDQDEEDHEADDHRSADHEVTERLDDLCRRSRAAARAA